MQSSLITVFLYRWRVILRSVAVPALVRSALSGQRYLSLLLPLWLASAAAQDSLPQFSSPAPAQTSPSTVSLDQTPAASADWDVGVAFGAGPGLSAFGSTQAHDLALATVHAGRLLDAGQADSNPFLRRLELAGELWTGAQYCPRTAYLVGLTPLLRCRFLPDSRWTPFLDGGGGVAATDIGGPDLSNTFQFNLLAGVGLEWRWCSDTAFLVEARYLHLSNGGIQHPNNGANSLWFGTGLTWFF